MNLRKVLTAFFLFWLGQFVGAQAYNTQYNGVSVPSVAGMAYGKQADIPVNQYTGTGSVNVPLHVVRDGSLQLPISLNYHTAGLPVYMPASTVGLGWNLQAGGIVSRTVQGMPDEDSDGYYNVGTSTSSAGPQIWNQNGGPTKDTEPDIFTFAANGMSGKFFLDANHNVIQVPKSDNRIEVTFNGPVSGDKTIDRILIRTPQGVKYYFGQKPTGGATYYDKSYLTSGGDQQRIAWHLVRIESADGFDGIDFIYLPHDYSLEVPSACPVATTYVKDNGTVGTYDNSCSPTNGTYDVQYYESWVPYLISPDSGLEQVQFSSWLREDLADNLFAGGIARRINSVSVVGGTPYAYDLEYNYFRASSSPSDPDKRLRLKSVQKRSEDISSTLTEPPYLFEYNGETYGDGGQFFPAPMDKNVDHWGYYNKNNSSGNDNNSLANIVPSSALVVNNQLISFGGASRTSYGPAMLIGSLKKVTYPTSGSMEISYEANTYASDGVSTVENLNSSASQSCSAPSNTNTRTLDFTSAMATTGSIELCIEPYNIFCPDDKISFLSFKVKNSGGTTVGSTSFNANTNQCLTFSPAYFNMVAGNTYTLELTAGWSVTSFELDYTTDPSNVTCGGLRISETKVSDGISDGIANDIVKTYHYESAGNASVTSGVLYRIPEYVFKINHYTAVWMEYSPVPLSSFNGYHVGYERVVVRQAGLGETETVFHTESSAPASGSFPPAPAQFDVDAGSLSSSAVRDDNNVQLASSTLTRNTNDQYSQYGQSSSTGYFHRTNRALTVYDGNASPGTWYAKTPYSIRTNVFRPAQSVNVLDGLTSTTDITYSTATQNFLPHTSEKTNSDGVTYKTESYYVPSHGYHEVRGDFVAKNMIHLPYQTKVFRENDWVGGNRTFYAFYDCNGKNPSYTSYAGCNQPPRPRFRQSYKAYYDAGGNLQAGTTFETDGRIEEYTSDGLVKKAKDENWLSTEYAYDGQRRLTEVEFDGHVKSYVYDDANDRDYLPATITKVDGTTTSYTYDDLSRLETVTDDCKNITTTYEYGFNWAGGNLNYVTTTTQFPTPDGRSGLDELVSRQYMDGLGREVERIAREQGPNANQDILYATEYDQYGRISRTFEPHLRTNNYGNYRIPEHDAGFDWYFTTHDYEDSPLSRPLAVTPPEWNTTTFAYASNDAGDQVKIDGGTSGYASGSLAKHTTIDANGNRLIVFTDKLGRKVLSRRTDASDTPGKRLDTYYVYDGKGQLAKVVPPGASPSSGNLIFAYRYDGEGKTIYKKLPDAEPIIYKYNNRDLLAAYQDGNLADDNNKWYAYNYDSYGRGESEGFYSASFPSSFDQLTLAETLITTDYGTSPHDKDKVKKVRTKIMNNTTDWLETTNTWSTCGLLTSQTGNNHLEPNASIAETTSYTYDGGDNLIESVYNHRYDGTTTAISAEHHLDHIGRVFYDFFQIGNGVNQRISKSVYDERGNVSTKYQGKTGLGSYKDYLQEINYSYLRNGMLEGINLNAGGLDGGHVGLPTNGGTATSLTYGSATSYDEKDLFSLQLYRDNLPAVSGGTTVSARDNGDITFVASQVRGRKQMLFGMTYDEYDRMTDAQFYERNNPTSTAVFSNAYRETLTYDERGNIETLDRKGVSKTGNNYHHEQYDYLDYDYVGEGSPSLTDDRNQLAGIDDNGGSTRGYHDQGGAYFYDDNGNTTYDPSRKINIEYNHLDLPTAVKWKDGNSQQRIEMTYDAAGTMLRREKFNATGVSLEVRDYVGGIEYVDDAMESVHHAEGRVYFGSGSPRYDYAISDHLGNTRILYSDLNNDGIPTVPTEIVQEEHYYPFGMKMTGPWMGAVANEKTAYQYNGIEHIDDFGLDVNMAMYRTLDPVIGRWWSVDPKAEDYMSWSPYNSMGNSPMVQIDPNGDALPFLAIVGIGAAVFGTGNLAAQAVAGNINSFGDGLEAFGTGAVAGAALTAGAAAGWSVPILGPVIKGALAVKATTTGISALGGAIQGITTGDWSGLGHAGKIFLGNFYSDPERDWYEQIPQLISRHSWELLQTEIGHSYSQLRNAVGGVDRVDLYRGATFTQRFNSPNGFGGVSLGNFINIGTSRSDPNVTLENEPDRGFRPGLLRHEYGHIFDSHRWGPAYLFRIGIPSAAGSQWTEDRADNFWRSYFRRNP